MVGFCGAFALHYHGQSLESFVSSLQGRMSALGAGGSIVSSDGLAVGRCGGKRASDHLWFSGRGPVRLVGQLRDIRIAGAPCDGQRAADELLRRWVLDAVHCFDGVVGDFAIVISDAAGRTATFARSPLSPFPLYVTMIDGLALFASMAFALAPPGPAGPAVSIRGLARRLTGSSFFHQESLFEGVTSVPPGCILALDAQGDIVSRRFWDPVGRAPVQRPLREAAGRMRQALDAAVKAAIAPGTGSAPVATHLSAGRDSTAVTSVAAAACGASGRAVIAYTSAPQPGFPQVPGRLIHDEGEAAALTAGTFPNVSHRVVRSTRTPMRAI